MSHDLTAASAPSPGLSPASGPRAALPELAIEDVCEAGAQPTATASEGK